MATETIVRPDAKGRIGLGSYLRRIAETHGQMPSGFAAEMTGDGVIVLRPRVEVPADEANTLLLSDEDRDRIFEAINEPISSNSALQRAKSHYDQSVADA